VFIFVLSDSTWKLILHKNRKLLDACKMHTRPRASTSMYSVTFRVAFALCCHSNATRAPIANPPNSAQLGGSHYNSPSYFRVRAIVWACGRRQTDTQTDTVTHRRPWSKYISRRLRFTRNVMNATATMSIVDKLLRKRHERWNKILF